ncbi:hypothetical protein RND81_11G082300 [Saponaria officinalis]|uniref:Myb-like domain-containing protein n=1 Tax=Saponaria officinalis TaxID=3572 RepID=A0AAW1HL11_SAPOF
MATQSNTSFHQNNTLSSGFYPHAISFHSTSNMIPNNRYYEVNSSSGTLMFSDNSNIISCGSPTATLSGNSSSSLLLDSVPGLKHDARLAVEWTDDEQYKLEEGLVKFKDEHGIMKYIKIAATLRDKTVRDVALRCRWMTRKRIKQEESNLGRKGYDRKDKFAESSAKTNLSSALSSASIPNVTPYSSQWNQMDHNQRLKCQVLSSTAKQLLEQNLQAFNQIDNNMTCLKLQDNIDLFCRARDNINDINAILNNMREFSDKMRQMQDLPISIDQNLFSSILPRTTL